MERLCPKCECEIIYNNYKSYHSAKSRNSVCRSCRTRIANASDKRNFKMENNPAWKGHKEIPFSWFSKYFERKGKKRVGTIKIKDVYDLWIKQDKKCALSGLEIDFIKRKNGISASIDRIDSDQEYNIENIQLVHKDVNLMKNHFSQEYFFDICEKIYNERKEKMIKLLPSDFYMENGKKVMTEQYHIARGYCCGSGCRHCPFEPKTQRGNTTLSKKTQ